MVRCKLRGVGSHGKTAEVEECVIAGPSSNSGEKVRVRGMKLTFVEHVPGAWYFNMYELIYSSQLYEVCTIMIHILWIKKQDFKRLDNLLLITVVRQITVDLLCFCLSSEQRHWLTIFHTIYSRYL